MEAQVPMSEKQGNDTARGAQAVFFPEKKGLLPKAPHPRKF